MSSSSAKAAAKALERISIMNSVRPGYVGLFNSTVTDMVTNNRFRKGQCVVLEIARAVARALGIREDAVEEKRLHNNWTCYEIVHTVTTSMPPPPKKGMPMDPPVSTITRFRVTAMSAIIEASYTIVDEDGKNMGSDVKVKRYQLPNPDNNDDNSDDSNNDN
ncbi:unnamed protein product [Arabidopsis arenosa]|uniref:Uncharacterized protein n=1 Tax=Arabidopsis arenosa TaxID=38785 RepID=A0A8S1ZND8_ARAAE|nr:unnamed protein product [Arabidopsis arenosa]